MNRYILLIAVFFLSQGIVFGQGCEEPDDDKDGVSIFGYIQPQFQHQYLGEDGDGKSLDKSTFYFNRARIGVFGQIPYDFRYYFMAELAPKQGGAAICDAFITYKRFAPYIKASIGQFKSPLSLEQNTACHSLYTINRSMVVNELAGPIRDMGLMFSGGTGDKLKLGKVEKNVLSYTFAIMNGTGRNVFDDNKSKDFIGRVKIHPLNLLTLGVSYKFGKHPPLDAGATKEDERSRMGFDMAIKLKNLVIQGEYISGSNVGSYTTGGGCSGLPLEVHEGSVDQSGYFALIAYKFNFGLQPVFKYQTYDPDLDAAKTGDIENIMTFGLNYFFNDVTRLQINYLYKAEENGLVERKNDELLIQMQIRFK